MQGETCKAVPDPGFRTPFITGRHLRSDRYVRTLRKRRKDEGCLKGKFNGRRGLPERAAGLERMDKTACGLGPPVILKVIHSAQEANSE